MKPTPKIIPRWVAAVAIMLAALLLISALARSSYAIADAINSYVATPLRVLTATLTNILPFSLFELMLILLLPAVILAVVLAFRDKSPLRMKLRRIFIGLGVVGIFYCGYLIVMTIPYNTTPLATHLAITEDDDITADELYRATLKVRDEINRLSDAVDREGSVSVMPYDKAELSRLISEAYASAAEEYPFFYNFTSDAKSVYFSDLMSDMGIAGIYTYFTGEANVNTSYPDYCYVYSAAHEFAHQRGINRENEANFMAFFVLSRSPDPYMQYSAYLNLYEYLASALYSADKDLYLEIREGLSKGAASDIAAASAITREHRESPLYKLMNRVNDAYLKSNGTAGVVSYGYVVRIAVDYLNNN